MRIVLGLAIGIVIGFVIAQIWVGPLEWLELGEETGEVVGDVTVTASVRAALALQKDFALFGGIEVSTERGVVTLEGTVASQDQSKLAEIIARGVDGVERVENRLTVAEPRESRPDS